MGRQGNDPTMVSSSIALLQERFKQLEKVKERREEKEFLKLFSSELAGDQRKRVAPTTTLLHNFEPPKLSCFQPEMNIIPHMHRQTLQDSLSLGLNLQTKQPDFRAMKMPPLTNLWPSGTATTASTSRSFENSDLDTTLHL